MSPSATASRSAVSSALLAVLTVHKVLTAQTVHTVVQYSQYPQYSSTQNTTVSSTHSTTVVQYSESIVSSSSGVKALCVLVSQVLEKLPVLQEVSWHCWRACRTLLTWRCTRT